MWFKGEKRFCHIKKKVDLCIRFRRPDMGKIDGRESEVPRCGDKRK